MTEDRLTPLQIQAFARHLRLEEKSEATMEKYLRDIRAFARWLDGREISKGLSAAWKAHLVERGYAPASINAKLSALNSLLEFLGLGGCRVKFLRVQRRLFRDAGRELTKAEYQRLLDTAHRLGQERLGLLVEAMGATGIRVSEVRYLTVEAARQGKAEISLKGKIRTILLPEKLCRKLGTPGWTRARCSPTICGTCLLWCSTGPAGTSSSWRTCWATAASRPPASTW